MKVKSLSLFIAMVLSTSVHAYIYPGTGSMIFQVLTASIMALLFMLKT